MNGFVAERPTGYPSHRLCELTGDETISGVDPRKQPYVCLKSLSDTETRCLTHLFLFQVTG